MSARCLPLLPIKYLLLLACMASALCFGEGVSAGIISKMLLSQSPSHRLQTKCFPALYFDLNLSQARREIPVVLLVLHVSSVKDTNSSKLLNK